MPAIFVLTNERMYLPSNVRVPTVLLIHYQDDERVPPLHSYKYVATIQATHPQNPKPLLLRVGNRSGHNLGKKTEDM